VKQESNHVMPNSLILSRTDSIGDVVLTLPMAGMLKEKYPDCEITFLGRSYTKDIIDCCENIDGFIDWDEIRTLSKKDQIGVLTSIEAEAIIHVFPRWAVSTLARQAQIPVRVGTSRRLHHIFNCNKLVYLKRKNTDIHESQLNMKLLSPFGLSHVVLNDVPRYFGLKRVESLKSELSSLLDKNRFNLILHPRSKGSAREWGLANFGTLIQNLPSERFKIFVTGTAEERTSIGDELPWDHDHVVDMMGGMSLRDLISFINEADGIVAASTGPLHIAAALGKHALGLYAPMRPIHPGRWAQLGKNARTFVLDKNCSDCRRSEDCHCIRDIRVMDVRDHLMELVKGKAQV